MNDLSLRGDGRTSIQAWDGSSGDEPPASRYTAARLVTQHVGRVRRASARGGIAASIDVSGLIIVRSFDDPERIVFSCRLREDEGIGVALFGPEEGLWLFACWKSGMALFERSGAGFELRTEQSFEGGDRAGCAVLAGDKLYVSFSRKRGIAFGRIEGAGEPSMTIDFPQGELALPDTADSSRFAIGSAGEIACASPDNYELLFLEPDGMLRWKRRFANQVKIDGIAFGPGGESLALCEGPFLRELECSSGRDMKGSPVFEDKQHDPVRPVYLGSDRIAVGNYQTVALLARGKTGSWDAQINTEWLVPSTFSAVCRDGARILFFYLRSVVSLSAGSVPYTRVHLSYGTSIQDVALRGDELLIADSSGRPKSLGLSDLSSRIGSFRARLDPFSDAGYPQSQRCFRRVGGGICSVWSNSVDDLSSGESIAFPTSILRNAAFSEEFGFAAVGGFFGKVSIFRWDGAIREELSSLELPVESVHNDLTGLMFARDGGNRYLVCVASNGAIVRYRLKDGGEVHARPHIGHIEKESETDTVSTNTILPVRRGFGVGVQHSTRSVQFFALSDLSQLMSPIGLGDSCSAILPLTGTTLFGSAAGSIHEYRIAASGHECLRTKKVSIGRIGGMAVSEDGRLLFIGGNDDNRIRILDAVTWDELAVIHSFDKDMIIATPPTGEDRAKGREFHAFYNPFNPDPTDDHRIAFYHSRSEEIRVGTGTVLDPAKAEDRSRIAEYLETLYGTEAIASGDYGRRMVLDAIWRPRRAAAALGGGRPAGPGERVAGLIEGGEP